MPRPRSGSRLIPPSSSAPAPIPSSTSEWSSEEGGPRLSSIPEEGNIRAAQAQRGERMGTRRPGPMFPPNLPPPRKRVKTTSQFNADIHEGVRMGIMMNAMNTVMQGLGTGQNLGTTSDPAIYATAANALQSAQKGWDDWTRGI